MSSTQVVPFLRGTTYVPRSDFSAVAGRQVPTDFGRLLYSQAHLWHELRGAAKSRANRAALGIYLHAIKGAGIESQP